MLLNWNEHLIKEKDKNDSTPLHLVVSAQYEPYVRRYGFRVPDVLFPMKKLATWRVLNANTSAAYQQDINGLYPVHIAALMNRRVAIAILHRKCRGCVGLRDKQGRSFLHIAVQYKSYNVVGYACGESEFASMMNFRNNDGNTALHLAVEVGDIWIFCRLLRKSEVLLNLRNKKGETPLDLAWSKRQETSFSYGRNPENVIHSTLKLAGAVHGSFWRDYLEQIHIGERKPTKEDEEKEEKKDKKDSAKLTDATRTLGIGLVLIASVTFSATFAVAGAFKTSDNNDGGTPTTHKWYFKAFIFANTLAFICSAAATISLMYSGMPMVKLQIRRRHFQTSLNLATSSLSCWAVAFTIGVYMVLAPGGRVTAIAISVIIPIVTLYLYMQELFLKMSAVRQSLIARRRIPSYGQRMRVWIISTFYAGRGR
ncbi:protein ACCELERATED CELL DEATH 6 isoform X1 [Brachypodium distachyon]|nr:protein ACCELERATED CELL DEATH 6 isoform X1 [Brachypodium distachyon]|eukprot:XP_024313315.1 protein ACCELERATED CELL DEATH 6 isoform X1 [Brachypodium distachyon]